MLADILHKIAGMDSNESRYYPRPSLAGPDRCIRQMVYWGMGIARKPLPGRAVIIFDDSSFHEELTDDWIRKSAYQLHSEQMKIDIGTKYGIHLIGHIDGIVTDLTGQDIHFEHKAINHFTFQKYWTGEIPQDYIFQTCLYNLGLKKDNPDINQSLLLIKNKNTSQYLEYLINYEDDTATIIQRINSQGETIEMGEVIKSITDSAFNKFAVVSDYIKQKKLPLRQYDIDDWHCQYCGWKQLCWGDYEKEFQELKTDEMLPNEIADMVRYSKELAGHRLDMEKEEKVLKEKIKTTMKDAGVREGKAGEYLCILKLQKRERLDKSLIPENIIANATQVSQFEQLNIRKLKENNHANDSV